MAVIHNPPGTPLPNGHPFKGVQIHFGFKPPEQSHDPRAQKMPKQLHDLQNLPEDPVIRPMLLSNGVPRHLWPDGVINGEEASELIRKHGAPTDTDLTRGIRD
jgi:hypothetical protein